MSNAERLGPGPASRWTDHRIEFLEAEIRSLRQTVRALADALLSEDPMGADLAEEALSLLSVKEGGSMY